MRIAVLTGGATAERAVAFAGAAQIVEALRSRGHTVRVVDTVTGLLSPTDEQRLLATAVGREPPAVAELDERERELLSNGLATLPPVKGAEVLFLCLHAGRGEGGVLQAVLDVIGVPYTGSGALASALAMDKDLSKRLFRAAGVPVPAWFMAPVAPEDVTTALGWPVIVKPSAVVTSSGATGAMNQAGTGTPAARNNRLERSLSIAKALASAPLPVYGTPITSSTACSTPPSPRPACRHRNSTSAPFTGGRVARPLESSSRSRSSSSATAGGSRPTLPVRSRCSSAGASTPVTVSTT